MLSAHTYTGIHIDVYVVKSLSRVRLFVTPWAEAHQAPPSMEFSRQEYWSELPFLLQCVCILTLFNHKVIFPNFIS